VDSTTFTPYAETNSKQNMTQIKKKIPDILDVPFTPTNTDLE